jgi:adenosine deaminase
MRKDSHGEKRPMKRIDLHRHLEGSLRLGTIVELGLEHGVVLPGEGVEGLQAHVCVGGVCGGLVAFLEKFRLGASVLADMGACWRVAREAVEDAAEEGLDYLELRFSPAYMGEGRGLDLSGVVEAVAGGVAEAAGRTGLGVGLVGVISRTYGAGRAWDELRALLENAGALVAVDLAGDEAGYPARGFARHFEEVRAAGLGVTVHAGEGAGAESVRDAVEVLGATRIGHATRAVEDRRVLDLLHDRGIGIECCLTSNLQTGVVPSLTMHPARFFLENGFRATLNTDDPAISAIDFDHEIRDAAPAAGLLPHHVALAASHAEALVFPPLAMRGDPCEE